MQGQQNRRGRGGQSQQSSNQRQDQKMSVKKSQMDLVEQMISLVKKFKADLTDEDIIEICIDNDFNRSEVEDIIKRYDRRTVTIQDDEWKEVRS